MIASAHASRSALINQSFSSSDSASLISSISSMFGRYHSYQPILTSQPDNTTLSVDQSTRQHNIDCCNWPLLRLPICTRPDTNRCCSTACYDQLLLPWCTASKGGGHQLCHKDKLAKQAVLALQTFSFIWISILHPYSRPGWAYISRMVMIHTGKVQPQAVVINDLVNIAMRQGPCADKTLHYKHIFT